MINIKIFTTFLLISHYLEIKQSERETYLVHWRTLTLFNSKSVNFEAQCNKMFHLDKISLALFFIFVIL